MDAVNGSRSNARSEVASGGAERRRGQEARLAMDQVWA